jgi:hypothetical protein
MSSAGQPGGIGQVKPAGTDTRSASMPGSEIPTMRLRTQPEVAPDRHAGQKKHG